MFFLVLYLTCSITVAVTVIWNTRIQFGFNKVPSYYIIWSCSEANIAKEEKKDRYGRGIQDGGQQMSRSLVGLKMATIW